MPLAEPSVLITDYVLAAVSLSAAAALFRRWRSSRYRSVILWAGALACTGIAAVTGGTYHGFHRVWPSAVGAAGAAVRRARVRRAAAVACATSAPKISESCSAMVEASAWRILMTVSSSL